MGTVNRAPPATRLPASKDCLDCTISRSTGSRLCWEHWVEFMLSLAHTFRSGEFRHATPTEKDRMVRNWVITGGGQTG